MFDIRETTNEFSLSKDIVLFPGNCLKANPAYGKGVADTLGIPPGDVPEET